MASATLDAVKELLAKFPDLPQVIKQAQTPKLREWADTAYIYNGFDDITLCHLGFEYHLKQGELTAIEGKPDYKEIDQGKSTGQEIIWQNLPMKGEFIAGELIYEHDFHHKGFGVFTTPEITDEQKRELDERGRLTIIKRIEEFKLGRDKAKAGIQGYKINPDPSMYRWMQKYSPDDAMFVESKKTDSQSQIAEAIALLTRLVTGQSAAVASAPLPAVEADKAIMPPRRRALEKKADYDLRVQKWAEELNAKIEQEEAEPVTTE